MTRGHCLWCVVLALSCVLYFGLSFFSPSFLHTSMMQNIQCGCSFPPLLPVLFIFHPPHSSISVLSFLSPPALCVASGKGVCDCGPVKSDLWDAKGGIVPYLPSSPSPAVWSSRSSLFLHPLSSWFLPVSLYQGVCCCSPFFSC